MTQPDAATEPFDVAAIDKIAETVVPTTVRLLVQLFLDELAERRPRIGEAIAIRDMPALARQAHALKSSAGTYGAGRLRQLSLAADRACQAGDRRAAWSAATTMLEAIDQAAAAIAGWLDRTAPAT